MKKSILLAMFFICFFCFKISYSADNQDVLKIYKNIRCLVCQGQSIYDSNSDFAETIKIVVNKKIEEGSTEEEIYDFLKNKYGEWIILKPDLSFKNLFLWAFPYLVFIFIGIYLFLMIKKRNSY